MGKLTLRRLCVTALVAGVYAALTIGFGWLSYGEVQFRVSEALNLLIFVNPWFAPGVILGCFISNLFSTLNPLYDATMGTAATAIAAIGIIKCSKGFFTASLWPVAVNGFIVGIEICIVSNIPVFSAAAGLAALSVAAGEFVVVSIFGVALMKIIRKNSGVYNLLKNI